MSRIRNLTTALAAAMLCAAPSLHAVELQSAGSDTKLSVYGFVWANANYYMDYYDNGGNAGSLFYNTDGTTFGTDFSGVPNNQYDFSRFPTRFGFASSTPSANLGDVKTKIEMDFNNGDRVPKLRHANISFGNWTIGRQWSLWNDMDASTDTVDWAGAIGLPCYDTPRFEAINFTAAIDKNNTVAFALERNTGQGDGTIGTATVADRKVPTLVAAYSYADSWGHLAVRVLGQNYGGYIPATATTSRDRFSKMFWAGMLSGDVKFGKDDLVFGVYSGKALGNYGTGFQAAEFNDTTKDINGIGSTGWWAGFTHNWTDKVRSNIVISGVTFKADSVLGGTDSNTGNYMKTGLYGTVNTFVALTKNLQFGAEYVYEQAKAFGNNVYVKNDGKLDNKFASNKIELALKATF